MAKIKDLTGQKFGRLTVLKLPPERSEDGRIQWRCECECGLIKPVRAGSLQSKQTLSCGCLLIKDLTRQAFGRLTVLEFAETKNGLAYWKCECECGSIGPVLGTSLSSGHTRSCGCGHVKDLHGQKFGRLAVIGLHSEQIKGRSAQWNCQCECGDFTVVAGSSLLSGHTRSCRCLKSDEIRLRALKRCPDGLSIRRIIKGISIYQAAERIGMTAKYLEQIEYGAKRFGINWNTKEIIAIYGDLAKFRKSGGREKNRLCIVCNTLFSGVGEKDLRRKSPTYQKTFALCSNECRTRWYAGERFKAPLLPPLMDAPKPAKERKRDREKAQISAVVKENIARKAVT